MEANPYFFSTLSLSWFSKKIIKTPRKLNTIRGVFRTFSSIVKLEHFGKIVNNYKRPILTSNLGRLTEFWIPPLILKNYYLNYYLTCNQILLKVACDDGSSYIDCSGKSKWNEFMNLYNATFVLNCLSFFRTIVPLFIKVKTNFFKISFFFFALLFLKRRSRKIKRESWMFFIFKKKTLAQVFPCKFCQSSKNNFFTEHLWETASGVRQEQPLEVVCLKQVSLKISQNIGKHLCRSLFF